MADASESPPPVQSGHPAPGVEVPESQPPKPGDESSNVASHDVPVPKPEPVPEPLPQPTSVPVPEPVPEPLPQPMSEPVPKPVPEPLPQPMSEPIPKPILESEKAGSPLDAEGESDSEDGSRVGSSRRRRKHSSASEDQEENGDGVDEDPDESEGDLDKEESHLSEEEEEKGTGQEEKPPLPKSDPTYVPTKGGFYLHDDRFADAEQAQAASKPPEAPKQRTGIDDGRWTHDLYVEAEQGPRQSGEDNNKYYENDRRPARSRKLNSFFTDADQRRLAQRQGERSLDSRGGRSRGRLSSERGGRGRPQHWKKREGEIPSNTEGEEGKVTGTSAEAAAAAPQDEGTVAEEKTSDSKEKNVVGKEDWPELEPKEGDHGDQPGAPEHEGGGEGKLEPKGGLDDKLGASEQEGGGEEVRKEGLPEEVKKAPATASKEDRGPSKTRGENEERLSRSDGKGGSRRPNGSVGRDDRRQRPDRPAYSEGNPRDSRRGGAHWDSRRGGRQGYRYEDDQRQNWARHRAKTEDEGGDVRSGRRLDDQRTDRGAHKRDGYFSSDAGRGKPRGGGGGSDGGGRYAEGNNRGERAPDQSDYHHRSTKGTTPPSGRVGERPVSPPRDSQRVSDVAAPRDTSRPADTGKPKSLFHTGESDSTKSTRVYTLSSEEGVQRLSVKMSGRGVGRGRGWKERLETPKEGVTAPTATQAGTQKSNVKVIESLEQRLLSGKTNTSPVAAAVEANGSNSSPSKDKEELDAGVEPKEKMSAVGKNTTLEHGEGAQGTKPKRYSSRRQKGGESGGDAIVGSEDVIPSGYGPGTPMIPIPWMDPGYQAYLAHQMQQMKLMMMPQPPVMVPQPPMMEMGYPGNMPYMFQSPFWPPPPPHSAPSLDSYPPMAPPPAPVPIPGMEEGGLPPNGAPSSYVPVPMSGLFMPQVGLDQHSVGHSPALPVVTKPRSQAIPIVSPPPPPEPLEEDL